MLDLRDFQSTRERTGFPQCVTLSRIPRIRLPRGDTVVLYQRSELIGEIGFGIAKFLAEIPEVGLDHKNIEHSSNIGWVNRLIDLGLVESREGAYFRKPIANDLTYQIYPSQVPEYS